MKTVMLLEEILMISCFVAAAGIAITTQSIKKASFLLYGLLLVWFIIFYLAIPGFRVYCLHDDSAWSSFADSPAPILFMVFAAVYCLLFYLVCTLFRRAYRYFARQ